MSREALRHEEFRDKVEISRIRDWFLCEFTSFNISSLFLSLPLFSPKVKIETESAYAPERLFVEAVSVMREKIAAVKLAAIALETGDVDVDMG